MRAYYGMRHVPPTPSLPPPADWGIEAPDAVDFYVVESSFPPRLTPRPREADVRFPDPVPKI